MKRYKNLSGDAGVLGYHIYARAITLQFVDGATYKYDYPSTGIQEVEEMKRLAQCGKGLSTYVNTHVKEKYALKLG